MYDKMLFKLFVSWMIVIDDFLLVIVIFMFVDICLWFVGNICC